MFTSTSSFQCDGSSSSGTVIFPSKIICPLLYFWFGLGRRIWAASS